MLASNAVQRVRVYVSESDEIGGRPRYLAALELLRESGATGATALRGVAGFGISQQLRIAQNESGRSMPIVLEWIDRAERIARILPALDALLPDALITVESVQVYRATLRSSGPFGERSVGELAREVATIRHDQSFSEAVRVLLESNQTLLPVVNEHGLLVGSVGAAELRRQQLPLLPILGAYPAAAREELLARSASLSLAQTMATEALALAADSSMLQAAKAMVEWGMDEVPVIARDGTFVGTFGIDQALQAAQEAQTPSDGAIRNAEAPLLLGMLMQGMFQSVLGYAPAVEGLERLLANQEAQLVVVDNGRPLGMLAYSHVLSNSEEQVRGRLLALPQRASRAAVESVSGETRVASLPLLPLPLLPTTATANQAIATLREQQVSWVAAVDEQGKLQGLVGQRTLLRALVQESNS